MLPIESKDIEFSVLKTVDGSVNSVQLTHKPSGYQTTQSAETQYKAMQLALAQLEEFLSKN